MIGHPEALNDWVWIYTSGEDTVTCRLDPGSSERSARRARDPVRDRGEARAERAANSGEQVEAIERWYLNDWMALDPKVRTSIVEGISVFLSLFDQPQVASMFCPPPPDPDESTHIYSDDPPDEDGAAVRPMPAHAGPTPPAAAARRADRRGPRPRPQHARGREPGARSRHRRAASRTPGCRRSCGGPQRPPAGPAATSGPQCSSATSIRRSPPWARTTPLATRRRSR